MNRIQAVVAAALIGISAGAVADAGHHSRKGAGPVKKEQKDWGIAGDASAANRTIGISMADSVKVTGMLMMLVIGAQIMARFLAFSRVPRELVALLEPILDRASRP